MSGPTTSATVTPPSATTATAAKSVLQAKSSRRPILVYPMSSDKLELNLDKLEHLDKKLSHISLGLTAPTAAIGIGLHQKAPHLLEKPLSKALLKTVNTVSWPLLLLGLTLGALSSPRHAYDHWLKKLQN